MQRHTLTALFVFEQIALLPVSIADLDQTADPSAEVEAAVVVVVLLAVKLTTEVLLDAAAAAIY